MTYAVTKKFHSGLLEGMEYKELTGVKFEVGKDYGEYIVTFCKAVDDDDAIAVEGSKFGVPCAFWKWREAWQNIIETMARK